MERTRAKVSDGWSRDKKMLIEEQGMNQWMIMNVRRKTLRIVCIEALICYGSKFEMNSTVNR